MRRKPMAPGRLAQWGVVALLVAVPVGFIGFGLIPVLAAIALFAMALVAKAVQIGITSAESAPRAAVDTAVPSASRSHRADGI